MLPASIKIGAKKYAVRVVKKGLGSDYGDFNPEKHLIRINANSKYEEQVETLLHEILHACCAFAGVAENETLTEEQFVSRVTPILHSVLKENELVSLRYEVPVSGHRRRS